MGADAFVAFYGLRYSITDDEVDAVAVNQDQRVIAARRVKLQTYFGRLTDGEPHFLFIGSRLGVFGVENESCSAFDMTTLERIMRDTTSKLKEAELAGEPQLHLQLNAQY